MENVAIKLKMVKKNAIKTDYVWISEGKWGTMGGKRATKELICICVLLIGTYNREVKAEVRVRAAG